jgi:polyhydroxybutyrate depolymerase|tara:strand:+ start:555 stop:1424 length:870 start_codon:yes stop_codon:yes gene_type:complete
MKNLNLLIIYLIFILLSCSKDEDAQLTPVIETGKMTKQLVVNNTNREYIIYVPENFTGTSSLPLLLSFHGLSSNMNFNYDYTNFDELAERENFIVVHPNGIDNRWTLSATNNPDIDFIEALLNQLENDYNIASNRIYSTGMSNGGNFSFTLACGLNDRIAAIASVTGLMLQMAIGDCIPSRPLAVLHIHGTEDLIANYAFVQGGLDFWTDHNNTNDFPIISDIPNIDSGDGSTVKRFEYLNGNSNVEVQHLKITGGGHEWPGFSGNMDINASEEVWNFVKSFDLSGKIE